MPASTKQPLSSASGRSVEVRMHTAGNAWLTLVKKLLSSGSVPESDTTYSKGVHLQAVVIMEAQRLILNYALVQIITRSKPPAPTRRSFIFMNCHLGVREFYFAI